MIYVTNTMITDLTKLARTRMSKLSTKLTYAELVGDFTMVTTLDNKLTLGRELLLALNDPDIYETMTDLEISNLYQRIRALLELHKETAIFNYADCNI